jgi:LruC domain-containing protein
VNGPLLARATGVATALVLLSQPAWAADPLCDPAFASVSFAPARGEFAMLLFEDNWPQNGDLDFNDQVVAYNFAFGQDESGQTISLLARFRLLANIAGLHNGLYLHLPISALAGATVVRTQDGISSAQAPVSDEHALVIPIVADTSTLQGSSIDILVHFARPVDLDVSTAPCDLFIARTDNFRHQIHLPTYGGTERMDRRLFGTENDGSSSERHFVNRNGLPFALNVPQFVPWPQETVAIDRVYPGIVGFAQSGGVQHIAWYIEDGRSLSLSSDPTGTTAPSVDTSPLEFPCSGDALFDGGTADGAGGPSDAGVADAAPPPDPRTSAIRYEWSISGAGQPSSCAEVGGDVVRLLIGPPDAPNRASNYAPCADGAYMLSVPPGDYGVGMALLRSSGLHISLVEHPTVTVEAGEIVHVVGTLDVASLYLPDGGAPALSQDAGADEGPPVSIRDSGLLPNPDGGADALPDAEADAEPQPTWSFGRDFRISSNPTGPWSVGVIVSSVFVSHQMRDHGGPDGSARLHSGEPGFPYIWVNASTSPLFGVNPGEIGLHAGSFGQSSIVRFTAPESGWVDMSFLFGPGTGATARYAVQLNGATMIEQCCVSKGGDGFYTTFHPMAGDRIDFYFDESAADSDKPLGIEIQRRAAAP